MSNVKKFFRFLHQAEKMKSVLRFSAIPNIPKDSTIDHSWRTTLMGFLAMNEMNLKLNREKVLKMALVHDIVEMFADNIDYTLIVQRKISEKVKKAREQKAIERIKKVLSAKSGQEIFNLWIEFDKGQTKEAKFVKAINKLETLTFLSEVGYKYFDKPELIVHYADEAVKDFPDLEDFLLQTKLSLKAEFKKGKIKWKKEYDRS